MRKSKERDGGGIKKEPPAKLEKVESVLRDRPWCGERSRPRGREKKAKHDDE